MHSFKDTLFTKTLFTILLLFGLHLLAYRFGWYASLYGFDKVMHTLGGITVAFLAAAFFHKKIISVAPSWWYIVVAVFVIGTGWEIFEYIVQFLIKGTHIAYAADSIGDIVFDIVGGMIGAIFVETIKKRYTVH